LGDIDLKIGETTEIKSGETEKPYGCKTVCINPSSIDIARELCKGTETGFLKSGMGINRMGIGYRSTPVVLGFSSDAVKSDY